MSEAFIALSIFIIVHASFQKKKSDNHCVGWWRTNDLFWSP
ncbi:hypothetical protein BCI9360_02396 [Bacillus sp. CECT 9360]|nr:hypothetical protein BCI9360_02396 [Bacillus sp. CECT 9360]